MSKESPTMAEITNAGVNVKESLSGTPGIVSVEMEINGFHFDAQYSAEGHGVYAIGLREEQFLQLVDILAQCQFLENAPEEFIED